MEFTDLLIRVKNFSNYRKPEAILGEIFLKVKITLETSGEVVRTPFEKSGEDVRTHSKRVEKM
jgi:hypothetical protein